MTVRQSQIVDRSPHVACDVRHSGYVLLIASCAVLMSLVGCGGLQPFDEGLATFPTNHVMLQSPRSVGFAYEVHSFRAENGDVLEGWFIPADNARTTVLISLGSITNRSLEQHFNEVFHRLGYNIFVYDYRGFGANFSAGSLETIVPDARAALEFVAAEMPDAAETLIVFGYSLGTVPTLALAAEYPELVDAVILHGSFIPAELPYYSLLVTGVLPERWDTAAPFPAIADPLTYIEDIAQPKLFLHSSYDLIAPAASASRLYDLAPEPKQFQWLANGHNYNRNMEPHYSNAIAGFLADALDQDR